jgi:hypothetical protein
VKPQHVHDSDRRHRRAKEFRTLIQACSDKQSSIASALIASFELEVYPLAINHSPAAMKSSKTFCFRLVFLQDATRHILRLHGCSATRRFHPFPTMQSVPRK